MKKIYFLEDITITLVDRSGKKHLLKAPVDMNMNLMELCKSYEFPVQGICGGMAMCASCQIYVYEDTLLNEKSEDDDENVVKKLKELLDLNFSGKDSIQLTSNYLGVNQKKIYNIYLDNFNKNKNKEFWKITQKIY